LGFNGVKVYQGEKEPTKPIYVAGIQGIYFPGVKPPQTLFQPPSPSKRKSLIPRMGFTWWDRIGKAQYIEKYEAVCNLCAGLIALTKEGA